MGNKPSNTPGSMRAINRAGSGNKRRTLETDTFAEDDDNERIQEKGLVTKAKEGYNELVHAIIRPPRAEYEMTLLGSPEFTLKGKKFKRTDVDLRNIRGQRLVCSHWHPAEYTNGPLPCVVYLHGNSSCRAEAMDCMHLLLSLNLSLFSFDFSGSGKSDGEYISLGWYERDDVAVVMEHLQKNENVSTIGLWGRSMGAATALMYGRRDPSIACLIVDSPFASLPQLARELVESAVIKVPKFAINIAMRFVRNSVKSRAKFDINKLEPIKFIEQSYIPVLFGAAEGDNFIAMHHSQALYEKYPGDKEIVTFEGNHNTRRERYFFTHVSLFLQNRLIRPALGDSVNGAAPLGEEEMENVLGVYDFPSPLADMRSRPRAGFGNQTETVLAKMAIAEEEDEMMQQAIRMSLMEFNQTQKLREEGIAPVKAVPIEKDAKKVERRKKRKDKKSETEVTLSEKVEDEGETSLTRSSGQELLMEEDLIEFSKSSPPQPPPKVSTLPAIEED